MNIHLTLSAPLPWLTAFAKLLHKKRQIGKQPPFTRGGLFILPRTPVIVTWNVLNKKKIFPSFSISIDEFFPDIPRSKRWKRGGKTKYSHSLYPPSHLPLFTAEHGYIIKL